MQPFARAPAKKREERKGGERETCCTAKRSIARPCRSSWSRRRRDASFFPRRPPVQIDFTRITPKWHRIALSPPKRRCAWSASSLPFFGLRGNPPDVYRRVGFVRLGGQFLGGARASVVLPVFLDMSAFFVLFVFSPQRSLPLSNPPCSLHIL